LESKIKELEDSITVAKNTNNGNEKRVEVKEDKRTIRVETPKGREEAEKESKSEKSDEREDEFELDLEYDCSSLTLEQSIKQVFNII
jgi:hypothetical protein